MGGGHYIAYARNAEGKWYCYNDSSCKVRDMKEIQFNSNFCLHYFLHCETCFQEVHEDQIDKESAYMLFYERVDLDSSAYMPRIDPRAVPIVSDDEMEAEENDLKKQCRIC